ALSALLAAACGGAVRADDGNGTGGASGGGTTGGASSSGGGVSFAGGAAGEIVASGAGGSGGQFVVPPEPAAHPPESCASTRQAQIQFSTGSDIDAGPRDGGVADAGMTEAGTVVDAGAIACYVTIPDYPPGDPFDPDLVNVSVLVGLFSTVAYYVGAAAACRTTPPATFEWYYDDPVGPKRIAFCADACEEFRRIGIDVVRIDRGCGGPRRVP